MCCLQVILSVAEHHSNLVPWQLVAQRTGAVLKHVQLTQDTQELDMQVGGSMCTAARLYHDCAACTLVVSCCVAYACSEEDAVSTSKCSGKNPAYKRYIVETAVPALDPRPPTSLQNSVLLVTLPVRLHAASVQACAQHNRLLRAPHGATGPSHDAQHTFQAWTWL